MRDNRLFLRSHQVCIMKNKYIKGARISEKKFRKLLQLFCLDLDATQIAGVANINRNTVNRYLTEIRTRIASYNRESICGSCADKTLCDRCFGRVDGKEASDGHVLIGINRSDKISCRTVSRQKEQDIRQGRLLENPRINSVTNRFKGIIDLETMKYERLNHVTSGSGRKSRGINGCDVFWGFAVSRLQRFRGLHKTTLLLHIQESKFRYNHDRNDLYPFLLGMFREQPLFEKVTP